MFARGNDKRRIFDDDVDRRTYLWLLGQEVLLRQWRCLAYCLMDNHLHLVLETPKANLGMGMQTLHGTYGRIYNDRHDRSGHLFQGRFGSVRIATEEHLLMVVAYVARNPVEAGLCAHPGDWLWSSHQATMAGGGPVWLDRRRLLSYLGARGGDPARRYADLTEG